MSTSFSLSKAQVEQLRGFLVEADKHAFYNVTHDKTGKSIVDADGNPIKGRFSAGGPFGALFAVGTRRKGFEKIGHVTGNAVIDSGIASQHAEDRAMQEDNLELVHKKLVALNEERAGLSKSEQNDTINDPLVVLLSNGQSCPTCATKETIMTRAFMAEGLIKSGNSLVLHGATLDDTFNLTQFYDAQYFDALTHSALNPASPSNLVHHVRIAYAKAPCEVRILLAQAEGPAAAVVRDNDLYALGEDERTPFSPFATAEVRAIEKACMRYHDMKRGFFGWKVDGVLYTTNREIGPLLLSTAGWTHIDTIVSVEMPPLLADRQHQTLETIGLRNNAFLKMMVEGYTSPNAVVRTFCDEDFRNTAQPQWARMLAVNNEQLYNGAAVKPEVELTRNELTRHLFAAEDIRNCIPGEPKRPCQPLDLVCQKALRANSG